MANRVFILPLRSDLAGVGLNLTDLKPNAGQKNSVYDGTPQNNYIAEMHDAEGVTVVSGIAYVSGSLNTTLLAAHNDIADDTTGGGNDVTATQQTCFGLAAYLFDRVQTGGGVGAAPITIAQANTCAGLIEAAALAGNALTEAAINIILAANIAGATTLRAAAGASLSFGTVGDILRILTGEIYRTPLLTILGTQANVFLALAGRQALVTAQTPAFITAQGQFYASGGFLAATDTGYRARPTLVPTGAFNISNAEGVIDGYKAAPGITVLNRNFAYTAATVTAIRPRARLLGGGNVAATGIGVAIGVYDDLGNAL